MSENYDPVEYMKFMKEFQMKTRGMLKGTVEYDQIRADIYKDLRQHHRLNVMSREDYVTADFDSFYINLIVVPEEID